MRFPRSCGTLVHPTSFPSVYGMGDLGPAAREFLDFLRKTGQTIWQVLPLGPTGAGNSPYNAYSAFAGNPFLISPDLLASQGLLEEQELEEAAREAARHHRTAGPGAGTGSNGDGDADGRRIDYSRSFRIRERLLRKAFQRFTARRDEAAEARLERFLEENRYWIDDFTLFMVLSRIHSGSPWNEWEEGQAKRDSKVLAALQGEYREEIEYQGWLQFEFFNQWNSLREYARERHIRIVGDIPIFVAHNSADVWAHRHYFSVDDGGNRLIVAGVPPDYFSETGQLWGNPVYRWEVLARDGYRWWVERFRQMTRMFDATRVDHFRGFQAGWQVAAGETSAASGSWVQGPGRELFDVLAARLGRLPIIAENLGVITPEVEELRARYRFPGMNVLQFAFDNDPGNDFLPHNHEPNGVVYSGTHDNDTTLGWYQTAPDLHKHHMRVYTRSDGSEANWELIRLGILSVCDQAIFPLQDFMNLGSAHRMNHPGTAEHNWEWRYSSEMLQNVDHHRIRELVILGNR